MSCSVSVLSLRCRGRKVTSLGVLFDFTGNDVNTTVQRVEDMVKEHWVNISSASAASRSECSDVI